jgi:large subunit ribosomal protein L20
MRARYTAASRERRKKVLNRAKGFNGSRRYRLKTAKEALLHAMSYEYRDRRNKKRDFRRLWINRISAFVRTEGISYSRFISGLTKAGVVINRKIMANLAVEDPEVMKKYVEIAKKELKLG